MRDPLMLLTGAVAVGLLMVLGRYTVTGQLDIEILAALGTVLGALITALSGRKKDGDNDDGNLNP